MGVFFEIGPGANYSLLPSTQFATINPGTLSNARSASRARSSRFGSWTCGTSRKIGAVNRNTTGLAAMDMLAALAKEKEEAIKAAKDSGLSARAFGVCWNLKDDEALRNAGISVMDLARDAETEMHRFPSARVNDDERRKLRATLYRPLLGLDKDDRSRVVDVVLAILLDNNDDDS